MRVRWKSLTSTKAPLRSYSVRTPPELGSRPQGCPAQTDLRARLGCASDDVGQDIECPSGREDDAGPAQLSSASETVPDQLSVPGEGIDPDRRQEWALQVTVRDGGALLGITPSPCASPHDTMPERVAVRESPSCSRHPGPSLHLCGAGCERPGLGRVHPDRTPLRALSRVSGPPHYCRALPARKLVLAPTRRARRGEQGVLGSLCGPGGAGARDAFGRRAGHLPGRAHTD